MGPDISIYILVSVLFGLLLLFVILRSLRLPKAFFDQKSERDAVRKQIIIKNILKNESSKEEQVDDDQVS